MRDTRVFFDIETSGLDPFLHEIIEVGYVIEDERGHVVAEEAFSLPFDEAIADSAALKVNGWGKRAFAIQIDHAAAAPKMMRDFAGATMVVNALQFDLTFASAYLHEHGMPNVSPWSHRSIDLKSVTAGVLGIDPAQLTTGAIMRHFGLTNANAHTALADAWFNRDWFYALRLYRG